MHYSWETHFSRLYFLSWYCNVISVMGFKFLSFSYYLPALKKSKKWLKSCYIILKKYKIWLLGKLKCINIRWTTSTKYIKYLLFNNNNFTTEQKKNYQIEISLCTFLVAKSCKKKFIIFQTILTFLNSSV